MEERISRLLARDAAHDRAALPASLTAYTMAVMAEARRTGDIVPNAGDLERARGWIDRPVFICGHHRTGTTLMQELLDGHPELLVLPSEGTYFTSFDYVAGATPSARDLERFVAEWIARFVDPNYEPHFRLGRSGTSNQPSVDFARRFFGWYATLLREAPNGFAALLALVATFRSVSGTADAPRMWVEKTPLNERNIRRLAVFPAARFIHLVRDPHATLASLRELYRAHTQVEFDAAEHAREIGRSLRQAHENTDNLQQRYLVVRYEDLADQTQAQMERVRALLGIGPCDSLATPTAGGVAVRSNSAFHQGAAGVVQASQRQTNPSAIDRALINVFAGTAARQFGYETTPQSALTSWAMRVQRLPKILLRGARARLRHVMTH